MGFNVVLVSIVIIILILIIYGNQSLYLGALISVLIGLVLLPESKSVIEGGRASVAEFPYKRFFIDRSRIPDMLNAIKTLKYIKTPPNLQPYPQRLELVRLPGSYENADVIGDLFTEKARMMANVDRHPSPLKFWQTREVMVRLEAKKKFPGKYDERDVDPTGKNAFALRETIYSLTKEANQFSPSAASAIYKLVFQYLGHKIDILDPFAGWGDRGLAAVAQNDYVNSYTGIDANSGLREGYDQIEKLDKENKVKFYIADSLVYLKHGLKGKFDLVFTSPPYYNYETYSDDKEQSIKGRLSYQDWLKTFYEPILVLLADLVNKNGIFIIHVGPTYSAPTFDTDTKKILEKTNLKFYNNISFNGGRNIPGLIYVNKLDKQVKQNMGKKYHGGCRVFC
jgi:16S rRNA G966 N2-methylase RsmD